MHAVLKDEEERKWHGMDGLGGKRTVEEGYDRQGEQGERMRLLG